MGLLELDFCGGYEVRHAGEVIGFRTRKALGMLAYLCLEPGMHSREHLAALLWPESDPQAARANLRTTLMYLRKPLKHEDHEGPEGPHLHVQRDVLGFNFDAPYQLDLDRWRDLPSEPSEEEMIELISGAGGPLMAGLSLSNAEPFEEWLRERRARWRNDMARALDSVSQILLDRKMDAEAETAARGWVELDPFDEKAHRRLMKVKAAAGDRSGALRTFEALKERLQEDLSIEPMPATQALAERIRRQQVQPEAASAPHSAWQQMPLARLPFVGREAAHNRIVQAYYAAHQRGAQVAIVEGEAGIGKTRLAEEFLDWARAQSARVLQGGGREAGAPPAYQPLVEALRPAVSELTDREAGLDEVWLGELSRIFPRIREQRPEVLVSQGDPTRALRLYESAVRAAAHLAGERGLVLFIDDLQWVDATSLDLLSYLARRSAEENTPFLLMGCVRAEDLAPLAGADRPVPAWVRSLERELPVERIALEQLSERQTGALLQQLLSPGSEPGPAERELIEWVYRETQGHPFFLAETMKALLENGLLRERRESSADGWVELAPDLRQGDVERRLNAEDLLPRGVKEIVRDRLAGVPAEAMDLLAAGAVLGQGFRFELAREIAALQERDALRALDLIRSGGLWLREDEQGLSYSFSHDKVRDVVYTEAGPERRRLYHRRAFERLSQADANEAELSYHAEGSGLVEEAFKLRLEAGRSAMEISAVHAAQDQFERARRLLKEHPVVRKDLDAEHVESLYQSLGRAHELNNNWDEAREVYTEYLDWARGDELPPQEALALMRLAGVGLLSSSELDRSEELLQAAVDVARRSGDLRAEAEAHARLSHKHFMTSERDGAIQEAEMAVELAQEFGDQELLARALNALSYPAGLRRPASEVEGIADKARRLYAELGDKPMEIDSAIKVGGMRQFAGELRESVKVFERAIEASREIENEWGAINALNHATLAYVDIGELDKALVAAQESVRLARRHPEIPLVINCLDTAGFTYRVAGRYQEALEAHQEAFELAEERTPAQFGSAIACQLCADHLALGDRDGLMRWLERARKSISYSWIHRVEVEPYIVQALLGSGDREAARGAMARLAQAAEGNARLRVPLSRCEARLAAAEGGLDQAVDVLQQGRSAAEQMGLVWPQFVVLWELAFVLRAQEEYEAAEETEAEGRELLDTIASTLSARSEREQFTAAVVNSPLFAVAGPPD